MRVCCDGFESACEPSEWLSPIPCKRERGPELRRGAFAALGFSGNALIDFLVHGDTASAFVPEKALENQGCQNAQNDLALKCGFDTDMQFKSIAPD